MENANANLKGWYIFNTSQRLMQFETSPVNKDNNAAAVFPISIEHVAKLEKDLRILH